MKLLNYVQVVLKAVKVSFKETLTSSGLIPFFCEQWRKMKSESWVSQVGKGKQSWKIIGSAKMFAWAFSILPYRKTWVNFSADPALPDGVISSETVQVLCFSKNCWVEGQAWPAPPPHRMHTAQGGDRTGNRTAGKGPSPELRSPVFLFLTIIYFWLHGSLLRWAGGFSSCRVQVLGIQAKSSVALRHEESSWARNRTRVPCIGSRLLTPGVPGKVLGRGFLKPLGYLIILLNCASSTYI